ncbi:MAG: penicillin acylase family protein [Gemmatimonadota bacterium]
MRFLRLTGALIVFAGALYVGASRIGPAPALGSFLDPAHGVWSLARAAAHPRDAKVDVAQLSAPVNVIYDDRAVPHIFATTEEDAYRAMGFVVARDRLFQMHLQTLAATGRLTEIAGPRTLSLDREMRGLGLPRAAERAIATAGDTAGFMRNARAYAEGVNGYISHIPASEIPLEFRITGTHPVEWKPIDSYHLFNRMGWTLAYYAMENDRSAAAGRVGTQAAEALFPDNTPIQEPIQPNGQKAPRFDFKPLPPPGAPDSLSKFLATATDAFLPSHALARLNDEEPRMLASNNWAVAPSRSASGHALLAGDPHLELSLPSIWYEVHLVVPGKLDVYGVTIPGAPGIVIGFNRDVAWTFTNTGADVLDYYAETVNDDAHPTKYKLDNNWKPLEERIEQYKNARGNTIATDTLYFTHRGPMRRVNGKWVSLNWTVLNAGRELNAFYGASHARSTVEMEDAMARSYMAPAQNMLSADRGGHIAIRSTGRYPVRPGDGKGSAIRDGSHSTSDWTTILTLSQYPQSFDPAQGYLASANQQPIDPSATKDWWGGTYDPWRALRINALLRADSAMTPEKMQRFQTDPGSERANLFVPYFLAAGKTPRAGVNAANLTEAAKLLGEWDRRYTKDNKRAVLFEEAMRELANRTWDELAMDESGSRRVATPSTAVLLELLSDSTSSWWDDRASKEIENRDDIVASSLAAALATVRGKYGEPNGDGWRWDHIRFAQINHLLRLPALSALDLPVQSGPGTLSPSAGPGTHGASWRMVVELGNEIRAWSTYPGGQSGSAISAHYRDRIPLWTSGQLEPVVFPRTPEELTGKNRAAQLTLSPRK